MMRSFKLGTAGVESFPPLSSPSPSPSPSRPLSPSPPIVVARLSLAFLDVQFINRSNCSRDALFLSLLEFICSNTCRSLSCSASKFILLSNGCWLCELISCSKLRRSSGDMAKTPKLSCNSDDRVLALDRMARSRLDPKEEPLFSLFLSPSPFPSPSASASPSATVSASSFCGFKLLLLLLLLQFPDNPSILDLIFASIILCSSSSLFDTSSISSRFAIFTSILG
mmetsp:Transcript_29634/g.45291  ORF Transcript_29634/g.45291 Transcript_29634/m.45291 type:complete len:225 (-) Transcript_29634:578-1252(-)